MPYVTDSVTPPPFTSSVSYYERSIDPLHESCAPIEIRHGFKKGAPEYGWMAIDWCENAIGFTADSTECLQDKPEFELKVSWFPDGRMFAYREGDIDLQLRHKANYEVNTK